MSSGVVQQIRNEALKLLEGYPDGMKYGELYRTICSQNPLFNKTTVSGTLVRLVKASSQISRPSRGLLILTKFYGDPPIDVTPPSEISVSISTSEVVKKISVREEKFYDSCAVWLMGVGDAATQAIRVGGSIFRGKWATPDVIGVYKPLPSDPLKFSPEIIAVEVKIDADQSIVAFGQAISYRLFSHRTIIVMPAAIEKKEDEHLRIKSLCELFGIGYVLFNADQEDDPDFRFIIQPRRFEPDMFYANVFASKLRETNARTFNILFG